MGRPTSAVRGSCNWGACIVAFFVVPSIASAQLLDRASSAVRGADGDGQHEERNRSRSLDDASDAVRRDSDDDSDRSESSSSSSFAPSSDSSWDAPSSSGTSEGAYESHEPPRETPTERPPSAFPDSTLDTESCEPVEAERSPPRRDEVVRFVAPGYPIRRTVPRRDIPFVRAELEGAYVIDGVGRLGIAARAQFPFLLDVSVRYSFFFEPVENDVIVVALGRAGLELRVFDVPDVQLRVGARMRHFHDRDGPIFGGDGVIALDVAATRPVVFSAELAAGGVGEAFLLSARGSVGVAIEPVEIYVGYDYEGLFNGDTQVDLGGPMIGVRAWL